MDKTENAIRTMDGKQDNDATIAVTSKSNVQQGKDVAANTANDTTSENMKKVKTSKESIADKKKSRGKRPKSQRKSKPRDSDESDEDDDSDLSDDSDFSDDSFVEPKPSRRKSNRRGNRAKPVKETTKTRKRVSDRPRRRNSRNSDSDFDSSCFSDSGGEGATEDDGGNESEDAKDREIENLRHQLNLLQQQNVPLAVPQAAMGHVAFPLTYNNSYMGSQTTYGAQHVPPLQPTYNISTAPVTLPGRKQPLPPPNRAPPPRRQDIAAACVPPMRRRPRRQHSETKLPPKRCEPGKPSFRRVDWYWDINDLRFRLRDTTDSQSEEDESDDCVFHVRRTFDPQGRYRQTFVDIKSKLLRECVKDVIGDVKGVTLVEETPKLDPDFLFLYLDDLRAHYKHLKNAKPMGESKRERSKNAKRLETKLQHLKVLLKYLCKDYSETKKRLDALLRNGLITFDLLWAIFKPKSLIYATTYGNTDEPRAFTAESIERHMNLNKGEYYYIEGKYLEFDGKHFGYATAGEEIAAFRGSRKITSLTCYPLTYRKDEAHLRQKLTERGKKFVQLSGVHYKSYSGMAYVKGKGQSVIKFNVQQSRMMVDAKTFRRVNPNYCVSPVAKPGDPMPYEDVSDAESDQSNYDSDYSYSGQPVLEKLDVHRETYDGSANLENDAAGKEGSSESSCKDTPASSGADTGDKSKNVKDGSSPKDEDKVVIPDLTDEQYLLASPVVLGFAFAEKQWLEFKVSEVKDINWNDRAWDSLVLDPETKDLIQALVTSRKNNASKTIDDVIQGKGKGLVTVLHGAPGTGKTLTAEGISELLKCPLYMVSAGELGTNSRFLEVELQRILDICHAWGAVLLLDEADVFLEKRNMQDVHRNALVSIFLRQLEYFQGILFLTTNRVETFDEAFQSRIHIALRYDNLDSKAKKKIFNMFLDKIHALGDLEVERPTDEEMTRLVRQELNGREIKNIVTSAQDLAMSKSEKLSMKHLTQVLDVHAKFGRDLRGGAGYEDAMRSYF